MNLPVITVFCPFTRPENVLRWFDDLASTDLNPEHTNLAFIIDIAKEDGGALIYERIMNEMNRTKYRKFLILRNYDHEVVPASIPLRRQRIAEIHEQSKAIIRSLDGDYILGLEDDTVFTNLCIERLYRPFVEKDYWPQSQPGPASSKYSRIGLVSTYEAGRWHKKIIGIWQFDNVNDPKECWTMLPGKDYEEIDAAGFYCYLTPKELYLAHTYSTEVWQPWGPDVNYGLDLRRSGYTNLVDWSQPCGHYDQGAIITPNNNLYVESFFKQDEPNWVRRKQDDF